MSKKAMSAERLDAIMNQIDAFYSELYDAGHVEEANALFAANDVLFELFEEIESQ